GRLPGQAGRPTTRIAIVRVRFGRHGRLSGRIFSVSPVGVVLFGRQPDPVFRRLLPLALATWTVSPRADIPTAHGTALDGPIRSSGQEPPSAVLSPYKRHDRSVLYPKSTI